MSTVPECWHGDVCPWHKRGRCLFKHCVPPPVGLTGGEVPVEQQLRDLRRALQSLDVTVANFHPPALGAALNVFTQEQIIQVSNLKAFSTVRTAVSMAACVCSVCEKHQTLYQQDRPGWLRRLGKLMLRSFTNQVLAKPDLLEGKHGREFCTGSGSAPTAQMEPLYRSGQQEVHQHYWPEERGVTARLRDFEFGTYFPAG